MRNVESYPKSFTERKVNSSVQLQSKGMDSSRKVDSFILFHQSLPDQVFKYNSVFAVHKCVCFSIMEARRNSAAPPPPPPPGICQRLRRFLADTISPSVQLEEDKRVPVIIHGSLAEVQGETSPESGSKKATAKKSVTIKEKREEIQVEALKKRAPSKREAKESHPPPGEQAPPTKLSKAISDINQRAMDFIEKRKRQVLGRSPTVLNNPKNKSST